MVPSVPSIDFSHFSKKTWLRVAEAESFPRCRLVLLATWTLETSWTCRRRAVGNPVDLDHLYIYITGTIYIYHYIYKIYYGINIILIYKLSKD